VLLIPGFAAPGTQFTLSSPPDPKSDTKVVYQVLGSAAQPAPSPAVVPTSQTAQEGYLRVIGVSPNGLKVVLPPVIDPGQAYAIWVANPDPLNPSTFDWSLPVLINDARPMWLSPTWLYASADRPGIGRQLKVVGRNLDLGSGAEVCLSPQGTSFTDCASPLNVTPDSGAKRYAALVDSSQFPQQLAPGNYDVYVRSDHQHWVKLEGQALEIRQDPDQHEAIPVSDQAGSHCGGCQPNDGEDDTCCVVEALHAATDFVTAHPGADIDLVFGDTSDCEGSHCNGLGWEVHKNVAPDEAPYFSTLWGFQVPAHVHLRSEAAGYPARISTDLYQLMGLLGNNVVRDLDFHEIMAPPTDPVPWGRRMVSARGDDITITGNVFDNPYFGITFADVVVTPPTPQSNIVITGNEFWAYATDISGGLAFLADSIIADNAFVPGASVANDSIALGFTGSRRLDISRNKIDGRDQGHSGAYPGFRAAMFFPRTVAGHEDLLISENDITCVGTKAGQDGEAIAFDANGNCAPFQSSEPVTSYAVDPAQTSAQVEVSIQLDANGKGGFARENYSVSDVLWVHGGCGLTASSIGNLVGFWLQVDRGPGLGQSRKITAAQVTGDTVQLTISPPMDVPLVPGDSEIILTKINYQNLVIGNTVDNSGCPGTTAHNAGMIGWNGAADSVVEDNDLTESAGVFLDAEYADWFLAAENKCNLAVQWAHYFHDIRHNSLSASPGLGRIELFSQVQMAFSDMDCFASGGLGYPRGIPLSGDPNTMDPAYTTPTPQVLGFGVAVSHNTVTGSENGEPWVVEAIAVDAGGLSALSPTPAYVDTLFFGNAVSLPSMGPGISTYGLLNGGNWDAGNPGNNTYNRPSGSVICGNDIDPTNLTSRVDDLGTGTFYTDSACPF
jgi:hypothetical protein